MDFWTAVMIIAVCAISTEFAIRITRICTRYAENVQRIRHGYPTLDGDKPADRDETQVYGSEGRLQ